MINAPLLPSINTSRSQRNLQQTREQDDATNKQKNAVTINLNKLLTNANKHKFLVCSKAKRRIVMGTLGRELRGPETALSIKKRGSVEMPSGTYICCIARRMVVLHREIISEIWVTIGQN